MDEKNNRDVIPFKMHPRVFAALGADLVTNDVVAVIELVKNSYDAFAKNVWIRFGNDKKGANYIEIEDDGVGMNRDTIENVWCLVATPFRHNNPYSVSNKKKRRVSGEKGLGRLSVARLGAKLSMLTKAKDEVCWRVELDWGNITGADSIESCHVLCTEYNKKTPFKSTGTSVRILNLRSVWDAGMINDLQENLARLISPFAEVDDFNIFIHDGSKESDDQIKIISPKFLSQPKYRIKGTFNQKGILDCSYDFNVKVISKDRETSLRSVPCKLTWDQIYRALSKDDRRGLFSRKTNCGVFDFEIRAWDIASDDVDEIADNFGVKKSLIRKAIKAHKGISVYRDGILILPKSETARDWLGLDLRRVSKVGTRLSTTQLVGHVSISAENNPNISDTSDRERLISTREVTEFEVILKAAVGVLENERDRDRIKPEREKPLDDLFEELSAEDLLAEVLSIAEEGAPASEAVPILQAFNKSLDVARKTIQERFVYYSRMATVGTIAQMLIHEIRNRTTIFGAFLKLVMNTFQPLPDNLVKSFESADKAIDSLERLSDTFAPLANRAFRRRKRDSNLKDSIEECLTLQGKDIDKLKITPKFTKSVDVRVAVDPGELDAVLLNLISNAVYWLSQTDEKKRQLEFKAYRIANGDRIRVCVDDNGPGIQEDYVDKVMWPGVTRKPDGIGMGLTVASELVAEYGGQLSIKHPGTLGGASFIFDLPIKK
jgi:signal transduction histidine kinase